MSCPRNFMLRQSCDVMDRFNHDVLRKFWGDYNIQVWKLNKEFSSFVGEEIVAFISNIGLVTSFMKENFASDEFLDSLITGLEVWKELVKFLNITKIKDDNEYENEMKVFEGNLKKFYTAGGKSFLTKGKKVGDDETFYMHALRCYIPRMARQTFDDHHLGIGIFTMQGYERRNKETKWCFHHHCNGKHNVLTQLLGRLHDIFYM